MELRRDSKGRFIEGNNIGMKTRFKKGMQGHKGFKHNKKTKEKMRQAKLRNPVRPTFWKDKKFTEEHKRNIGNSHLGEKHWNWKGGIAGKNYPIEWNNALKIKIYQRDNYNCQKCKTNKQLVIHHIDKNKKNCSEINLITLCRSCHIKLHGPEIKR